MIDPKIKSANLFDRINSLLGRGEYSGLLLIGKLNQSAIALRDYVLSCEKKSAVSRQNLISQEVMQLLFNINLDDVNI